MNHWTDLSIQYANQRAYLDDLFHIYPTIPDGIREVDKEMWGAVELAYETRNNKDIVKQLLSFELFPIKDSYVAYLKRDPASIARNPNTINRLSGRLYEMGLNKILERSTEPKETNRQIGPLFKRWVASGALGLQPVSVGDLLTSADNAVFNGSDAQMMDFAKRHLGYKHDKGLDFICKFNNRYIIGEAKFLTDFGGHQNAQFSDAISTLNAEVNAITVAVLDGVLYIRGNNKMFRYISSQSDDCNIMSALVFRDFLYSI